MLQDFASRSTLPAWLRGGRVANAALGPRRLPPCAAQARRAHRRAAVRTARGCHARIVSRNASSVLSDASSAEVLLAEARATRTRTSLSVLSRVVPGRCRGRWADSRWSVRRPDEAVPPSRGCACASSVACRAPAQTGVRAGGTVAGAAPALTLPWRCTARARSRRRRVPRRWSWALGGLLRDPMPTALRPHAPRRLPAAETAPRVMAGVATLRRGRRCGRSRTATGAMPAAT